MSENEENRLTDFISYTSYKEKNLDRQFESYFTAMNLLAVAWCWDKLHDIPKQPGDLE
ncbi:hypothetical protein D3C83_219540 [compost metagenome]